MSIASFFYTLGATGLVVLMATRPTVTPNSPEQASLKTADTAISTTAAQPEQPEQAGSTEQVAQTDQSSATTPTTANTTPDYEREQRMINEIRDAIFDGEVVELSDGEQDFSAILTEAEDARGTVIILHGRGFHADWTDTVNPLRTLLPTEGWNTLSVQMPVLEKQAKYYDYVPLFPAADKRIDAAIQFLKDRGDNHIVLLGHSCGGHMAMHWLENNNDQALAAVIGLGLGATDYRQFMANPLPLDKLTVPVLDVYGEADYPAVIKMAPERLAMMQQAGNTQSAQIMLPQANHYFTDKGEALAEQVSSWLNGLTL